ncbi:MAG: 4Fe-4S dicluster domain-containing protein [Acidobacteriia bacterium]|nr:4Fe-4S dicluster domain-containing protein [Terriglobia bacterium]
MKAAILTDTTKCNGCHECVAACKKENKLPLDLPRRWDLDDGLSARNWTSIVEGPKQALVRKQCRHCLEPACASACPVGALHQTELGAVVYDSSKCMGCRYCMMACPYGIPRYDWQAAVPYVRKCVFCYHRISAGRQPACTEACPTKATIFGDRDQLLAEAHRRIRDNPGVYVNTVWGEDDVGGSSVLYISNVDLAFLTGGRSPGTKPLPSTTALAMEAVPFTFCGVLALMAGVHWIVDRRMNLHKDEPDE